MLTTFGNVLGAAAVLLALPLFFAGFVLAPLLVLLAGLVVFAVSAPD